MINIKKRAPRGTGEKAFPLRRAGGRGKKSQKMLTRPRRDSRIILLKANDLNKGEESHEKDLQLGQEISLLGRDGLLRHRLQHLFLYGPGLSAGHRVCAQDPRADPQPLYLGPDHHLSARAAVQGAVPGLFPAAVGKAVRQKEKGLAPPGKEPFGAAVDPGLPRRDHRPGLSHHSSAVCQHRDHREQQPRLCRKAQRLVAGDACQLPGAA